MGRRVVIVGAGPAGCAVAVQSVRLGLEPTLLDKSGAPGGLVVNAFGIENYPGVPCGINGPQMVEHLAGFLARFDLAVRRFCVDDVAPFADGWRVTGGTKQIEADFLVMACGTTPNRMDETVVGGDGALVTYHVSSLLDQLMPGSRVAVIGGGEAALDYALTLWRIGAHPIVLCRSKQLRARGRLATLVAQAGIQVRLGWRVRRMVKQPAGGVVLTFNTGADLQVDEVLAAIGRHPAFPSLDGRLWPFLPPAPLTPMKGLFICGDARVGGLGQVGIAVGDGLAAAMEMGQTVQGDEFDY